jgi:hypothetical protein
MIASICAFDRRSLMAPRVPTADRPEASFFAALLRAAGLLCQTSHSSEGVAGRGEGARRSRGISVYLAFVAGRQ